MKKSIMKNRLNKGKGASVIKYVCKKCGWQWLPKNSYVIPRSCPRCKSYSYNGQTIKKETVNSGKV